MASLITQMNTDKDTDTQAHGRFESLLLQHRGIVLKVAGSYAWQAADRDDLAQEIAAQLWRSFPAYDPARPFGTWMYRIALNVAISHVRQQSRGPLQTESWDDARHDTADPRAHDPEARQQVDRLYRFIHQQPALDRALLLLHLEDHAYRDIAEVLGISETNVATKISRLKQRIRDEL